MTTRNFAQRYPKHIKQFIKDGYWYALNTLNNLWHCRCDPDQETKDRLIQALLDEASGVEGLNTVEELRSYSRIFS